MKTVVFPGHVKLMRPDEPVSHNFAPDNHNFASSDSHDFASSISLPMGKIEEKYGRLLASTLKQVQRSRVASPKQAGTLAAIQPTEPDEKTSQLP